MTLKTTVADMRALMQEIMQNLDKSERGNRSAAQRARLYSLRFEKTAKQYRKESIEEAKKAKSISPVSQKPMKKKRGPLEKSKKKARC